MAKAERTRWGSNDSQGRGQIRKGLIIKKLWILSYKLWKAIRVLNWSVALTVLILEKITLNYNVEDRLKDTNLETGKRFRSVCNNPGKRMMT